MIMTSPGLKRPQDFELTLHGGGSSGNNPSHIANGGNKRRCTNFTATNRIDGFASYTNSIFRDPSSILMPLGEEISAVIKEEIHKKHDNHLSDNETPLLSVRQTHSICERLIRDRERRLKEEYDRVLAMKLAEQYDLPKQNYYVDSRIPTNLSPPNTTPSINALAAAFTTMHRTNTAATSLPDLSTLAATLSASGQSPHLAFNIQQQAAAAAAAMQAAGQQRVAPNNSAIPSGPVLLASNLDEQLAVPEALFTLFGVFGDVVRVKILFNKKDNALIQMADANQAQVAQGNLDKQKVFGKIIRVTRSKHQLVQMPREGNQSDAGLTKDFTNSPLHRFKFPGSRNYLNIYPPSNTLHISNIPLSIDEGDLQKAFGEACGFEFSSFKFFPKDRKMALMRFNTVEQATIALIKMHNYQMSDDNNLRVSFSKSVM